MPKPLQRRTKKGDISTFESNAVLVEYWHDRRPVSILSTIHSHSMTQVKPRHGTEILKPKSVSDYNKFARGIDKCDMMTTYYSAQRKSMKWTKKMFFHALMRATKNAFEIRKSMYGSMSYLDFVQELIRDIIQKHGQKKQIQSTSNPPLRLTPGNHFLIENSVTPKGKVGYRRCRICASTKNKKRGMTAYHCKMCLVPLCVTPCCEIYHTKLNI